MPFFPDAPVVEFTNPIFQQVNGDLRHIYGDVYRFNGEELVVGPGEFWTAKDELGEHFKQMNEEVKHLGENEENEGDGVVDEVGGSKPNASSMGPLAVMTIPNIGAMVMNTLAGSQDGTSNGPLFPRVMQTVRGHMEKDMQQELLSVAPLIYGRDVAQSRMMKGPGGIITLGGSVNMYATNPRGKAFVEASRNGPQPTKAV